VDVGVRFPSEITAVALVPVWGTPLAMRSIGSKTMTTVIMSVLGWLVIAHGLSHLILALQQGLTASLWIDAIPVALYAIGMIGFLAAGLGLLGVGPLRAAIGPLLVLASGLSLVAVVQFGNPALWFGGFCDAGLLAIGIWRGYSGWPTQVHERV
jgi:hypothetical protein